MSISVVHSKPPVARSPQYNPSIPVDFEKAVQAAKLAEAVLVQALPAFSTEIRTVGARKGKSGRAGAGVAKQLGAHAAASLAALWSVRNARLAGVYAVFRAAAHKPSFGSTMVRILGQAEFNRLMWRIEWRGSIRP